MIIKEVLKGSFSKSFRMICSTDDIGKTKKPEFKTYLEEKHPEKASKARFNGKSQSKLKSSVNSRRKTN